VPFRTGIKITPTAMGFKRVNFLWFISLSIVK